MKRTIGLEYEFLGVQRANGQAVTRDLMKALWKKLAAIDGFELIEDIGSKQPIGVAMQTSAGEVVINTDAGICVVEFGFLPFATLEESRTHIEEVFSQVLPVASSLGIDILSYGLQPKTPFYFPDLKTEKIWYRGYLHIAGLEGGHSMFHNIAAHQVCIDVSYDELIPALNMLNGIAPATVALFANSGWGEWKTQKHHSMREYRWKKWTREQPEIAGMPPRPFTSFRDYLTYNWSIPMRPSHKDGTLHVIEPAPTIEEFLRGSQWEAMDVGRGEPSMIRPSIEDVNLCNMYIWTQARPKFYFKGDARLEDLLAAYDSGDEALDAFAREHVEKLYIEVRNIAAQPWEQALAAPAFITGLVEELPAAEITLEQYSWEELRNLHERTVENSMKVDAVIPLAQELVKIAQRGLQNRGFQEEQYITCLQERIHTRMSPAEEAIQIAETGGAEEIINANIIKI